MAACLAGTGRIFSFTTPRMQMSLADSATVSSRNEKGTWWTVGVIVTLDTVLEHGARGRRSPHGMKCDCHWKKADTKKKLKACHWRSRRPLEERHGQLCCVQFWVKFGIAFCFWLFAIEIYEQIEKKWQIWRPLRWSCSCCFTCFFVVKKIHIIC